MNTERAIAPTAPDRRTDGDDASEWPWIRVLLTGPFRGSVVASVRRPIVRVLGGAA
ncbi:hypothetical protein Arub01_45350 [Actinomadura rubrobrunea]|uniref:Uncharacterized protein n=1 Tax=Actinomadura rubrobrunea TaxID=115335 RepID=A0A9W6Q0H5_9ACTN|nr:hypothetical protein Arub01_45350 [Actinomadura rubrobrunea]